MPKSSRSSNASRKNPHERRSPARHHHRGLTALLIRGMGGLWPGATTDHEALAEILARSDFSSQYRAELEQVLAGGNVHATTP